MARTPDRRPGEADEEGIVLENRTSGDNPTIAGGIRYVDGAFSFKDSLGLFNPRSPLSAAGLDTEIQYNYLGFLSASSDLKFARDRRALIATNISGSLTKLSDGTSFIIAGGNISVVTGSNGSISLSTINSGTISGVTPGTGLLGGGSSGSVSLGINDSIVATISGSTFIGAVKFNSGLSGSLTRLADGTSYIASGVGINVATGSTGRITVSLSNTGSAGTFGSQSQVPVFATDAQGRVTGVTSTSIQISEAQVTNLTSSLSDRALKATSITAGNGLSGGGDLSTNRTLSINNSVVATLSGSTFSGVVNFNAGLSGSLTRLTDGSSYLVAGAGIAITTGSNGSVVITNDGTVGDIASVNAGTGLLGGGTSGHVTLNINDSVVATVSGTTFTGATRHTAGLSGSLTNLSDGSSYLRAGDGITVITGSNGSVTISLGAITYATASFTDATSVTVNHDIGLSLYDIEVFDSAYGKMIPKSATATSPTQANIQFSIPTSGWIAVGGPVAGGSGASTLGSITPSVGSAPYYGVRAWVSFDGTGTVSIRASQNVSSITDNGTGQFTVNFTIPMEDINYNTLASAEGSSGSGPLICGPIQNGMYSTSSVTIHAITFSGSDSDSEKISVTIVR
jgi:hypothetical protein